MRLKQLVAEQSAAFSYSQYMIDNVGCPHLSDSPLWISLRGDRRFSEGSVFVAASSTSGCRA